MVDGRVGRSACLDKRWWLGEVPAKMDEAVRRRGLLLCCRAAPAPSQNFSGAPRCPAALRSRCSAHPPTKTEPAPGGMGQKKGGRNHISSLT